MPFKKGQVTNPEGMKRASGVLFLTFLFERLPVTSRSMGRPLLKK